MSDPTQHGNPPDGFEKLSFYILESLRTLTGSVANLTSSLADLRTILVSKSELRDLRQEWEAKHEALIGKIEAQNREYQGKLEAHERDLTELKVKALFISGIAGAAMSWLVKRLGG